MRPWLLVGWGVRPLAQAAARAGLAACAIDAFADRDTRCACDGQVYRLPLGRWSTKQLTEAIAEVQRRYAPEGFAGSVAGGGLDNRTDLRAVLAHAAPLAGISGETLDAVRVPTRWFSLLDELDIPHPVVCYDDEPPRSAGWLVKSASGSGGMHVRRWIARTRCPADGYFQCEAAGEPASMLFVASKGKSYILGWQRQLLLPTKSRRWRYGGIATHDGLPEIPYRKAAEAASALCAHLPLRGLMGLDFLVTDESISVLELNPRPTASIALHLKHDPFTMHLAACAGEPIRQPQPVRRIPRGEAILYAEHPLSIAADFPWPRFCADIPTDTVRLKRGDPICSVRATAPTQHLLLPRLEQRRVLLLRQLTERYSS